MKPELAQLQSYPFQKLAQLKAGIEPPAHLEPISLSLGEPQHRPPAFVLELLQKHQLRYSNYPSTRGSDQLRNAIAQWLARRFVLPARLLDPERNVLPLTGSREGLFSIAQCLIDPGRKPLVMMPNPFYQIYEGAALLAGAQPVYMNCDLHHAFVPDLEQITKKQWQQCQLLYTCSPGNPTGAVNSKKYFQKLIELAETFDFTIVSDECYSEIYSGDNKPAGLLEACFDIGNDSFKRCLVMNSLSKRSNLAGLRSGFIAGDASLLDKFLLYRTYHGSTLPIPVQIASAAAWSDEEHVINNRALYANKFATGNDVLQSSWPLQQPAAAFFYWAQTPIDDQQFCQRLFAETNVTVLPGSFLSRPTVAGDPGANRVRMALVADEAKCREALQRVADFVATL